MANLRIHLTNALTRVKRYFPEVLLFISVLVVGPLYAATDHSSLITSYEGSKTCRACHPDAVRELLDSIHYRLMGSVQAVYDMFSNKPVAGIHGKGDRY